MDFKQASRYMMPFGKYRGLTIDTIAETDEGLRYLDWLLGCTQSPIVKHALQVYCTDPTIAKEIEKIT